MLSFNSDPAKILNTKLIRDQKTFSKIPKEEKAEESRSDISVLCYFWIVFGFGVDLFFCAQRVGRSDAFWHESFWLGI